MIFTVAFNGVRLIHTNTFLRQMKMNFILRNVKLHSVYMMYTRTSPKEILGWDDTFLMTIDNM